MTRQATAATAASVGNSARSGTFVAVSEIEVSVDGADALEAAFANRLGEVEDWPGFLDLQVWRDDRSPGCYVMVSWWRAETDFVAYLRSDAHRRSHARIPGGPDRARAAGLRRFELIAR
jgi:heme-degrading monooxygenase HmoA